LRSQIIDLAHQRNAKSYLEIGCDQGYTLLSLARTFEKTLGIDIDPERVKRAQNNATKYGIGAEFIVGTSFNIPMSHYDIVLIDAAHDYANVVIDFENVKLANHAKEFAVVFHDYGLVAGGVKRVITELFSKYQLIGMASDWNPLGGPVDDYEAALVIVEGSYDK
jgi:SAM-dependent methyltransferase